MAIDSIRRNFEYRYVSGYGKVKNIVENYDDVYELGRCQGCVSVWELGSFRDNVDVYGLWCYGGYCGIYS